MSGLVAIDWGSTNLRGFALAADGTIGSAYRAPKGVLHMTREAYPALIAELCLTLHAREDTPVLIGGMAGSNRGWIETVYVAAPAHLTALARHLHPVRLENRGIFLCPGVKSVPPERFDVMRGEELQILGIDDQAIAHLCLPGTHTKWARRAGLSITGFRTVLSGEIFDLIKQHSMLSSVFNGENEVFDADAFDEGLGLSRAGEFLSGLFGMRARAILDRTDNARLANMISGLIIGQDVSEGVRYLGNPSRIGIAAGPALASRYARALTAFGIVAEVFDGDAAFARGAHALAMAAGLLKARA